MSHRVLFYGLGPIGLRAVQLAQGREDLEIVGAVDIDPAKVGKDLGDLLETNAQLGIQISDDAMTCIQETRPDLIVHCTSSWLPKVETQLLACL